MEQGSAVDTAAEEGQCPTCGYRTQKRDRHWVPEYGVVHVVCYNCGKEWVE